MNRDELARARIAIAPVAEQELDGTLATSGRIAFDDALVAHVFSPIAGRITRLDAKLGDHVVKGATLAVITSPDLGVATSDVAKARADVVAARRNFERQRGLFAQHAASELDVETAEDGFRRARAELERAEARLALMHVEGDEVHQGYPIRAELEGDVIARGAGPGMEISGQYATGGATELFTIGRLDRVWVFADLYELDLARVAVGDRVEITTVAYPDRRYAATVDWVSTTVDPGVRAARVRCTVANPDHALRPEMYASVRIATARRRGLAIPRAALFRAGDFTYVFVVRDPAAPRLRFARIPVVADEGQATGSIEVTRGLRAGQVIAVSGVPLLRALLDRDDARGAPPLTVTSAAVTEVRP